MLDRVEQCLDSNPPFFDQLIFYVKQRGWNNLVRFRT
jgi:hypothetical protein